MANNKTDLVDDIITFFQKLGASNELSDRNFDTGEFFSLEYCNYIIDLAKKYGLYDEVEEAKNVNYIVDLEDELTDYFREKLIVAFKAEK